MKEKILTVLKLKRGNTSSPSDRTLETLATILSANISEETQIAAAVEPYTALLQDFSGETSHLIAEAVKNVKPVTPPAPPTNPPTDVTEPAWFTAFKEAQLAKSQEIEDKLSGIEKQKTRDAMIASAKNAFFKKYKISDSEKALCEKALAVELKMNQHETADSLMAGWKTQYEDFRSASGLGGIEPVGANDGGGGKKGTPILNELKSKLQRDGKLPTPPVTV